ncbi:bacillithiol system redox-active protein YtxJ [soil metagenome]
MLFFMVFNFLSRNQIYNMHWIRLNNNEVLEKLVKESYNQPVIIYKHSTRCSISSMVLQRLERSWKEEDMEGINTYFVDVISNRDISNQIAKIFNVMHESPQLFIVSKGDSFYDASHSEITYPELKKQLQVMKV